LRLLPPDFHGALLMDPTGGLRSPRPSGSNPLLDYCRSSPWTQLYCKIPGTSTWSWSSSVPGASPWGWTDRHHFCQRTMQNPASFAR